MKGFALVLLCALAGAQARSTGVESGRAAAALGDNPWLVHLRVAVSTSGFLESCVGSLVHPRWALTTASCLQNARFIWVRYGAVDVVSPTLVTETSAVRVHADYDAATGANDVALVSLNRHVLNPPNPNIASIALATDDAELPASAKFCTYGADENDEAGEYLSCVEAALTAQEDGTISADAESTRFDLGAPLVQDGVQYGILTKAGDSSSFVNPAAYRAWIEETAEIELDGPSDGDDNGDGEDDGEVDGDDDGEADGLSVHFVN